MKRNVTGLAIRKNANAEYSEYFALRAGDLTAIYSLLNILLPEVYLIYISYAIQLPLTRLK
jgi:hypothetical protein